MMMMSTPPFSANLAEMPVPAPAPIIGFPDATCARKRFKASWRGINGIAVLSFHPMLLDFANRDAAQTAVVARRALQVSARNDMAPRDVADKRNQQQDETPCVQNNREWLKHANYAQYNPCNQHALNRAIRFLRNVIVEQTRHPDDEIYERDDNADEHQDKGHTVDNDIVRLDFRVHVVNDRSQCRTRNPQQDGNAQEDQE